MNLKGNKDMIAILDRNIITRISKLASGEKIPEKENQPYKTAAAIMAFLMLTDSIIEPGISLHEFHKNEYLYHTEKELVDFQIADNLHPQVYVDLVLDRSKRISSLEIEKAKSKINLSESLDQSFPSETNDWKIKYLFSLVAVSIKKDKSLSCGEQILKAIDWMFYDALFDFVSYIFLLYFFSNKKQLRIVKKINTKKKSNLLANIKNTAWDLSYL